MVRTCDSVKLKTGWVAICSMRGQRLNISAHVLHRTHHLILLATDKLLLDLGPAEAPRPDLPHPLLGALLTLALIQNHLDLLLVQLDDPRARERRDEALAALVDGRRGQGVLVLGRREPREVVAGVVAVGSLAGLVA